MKRNYYVLGILIFMAGYISAQTISFVPQGSTKLSGTPGNEIVFDIKVKNISTTEQSIYLVRKADNMPENWSSSLCFGVNCFAPFLDSVATTTDYGSTPLQPGEERDVSLHVFTSAVLSSTTIKLTAGANRDIEHAITQDFTATTQASGVDDKSNNLTNYTLAQNYPNPFNPSTSISYSLPSESYVKLSIYNSLGQKVKELVNEIKSAGTHQIRYDALDAVSGLYFYTVNVSSTDGKQNFSETKKMLLIK